MDPNGLPLKTRAQTRAIFEPITRYLRKPETRIGSHELKTAFTFAKAEY